MTNPNEEQLKRIHTAYLDYTKIIRTWLVLFGVGGPVMFLTQEHLFKEIKASEQASVIGLLFISGVILQVSYSIVFKWMNWVNYDALVNPDNYKESSVRLKFALLLRRNVAVIAIFDLLTAMVFSYALWLTYQVLFQI